MDRDSKKLLVLSDTHGSVSALSAVLSWAKELMPPNDTICGAAFLGDGISDLHPAVVESGFCGDWIYVRGNNDYDHSIPDSAVFDFADHRFFLCHGHKYSLYGGCHTLAYAAKNNNADIVLFGHTHVPSIRTVDGIMLINPGSIGRPRNKLGASFAILECPPANSAAFAANTQLITTFWGIGPKGQIKEIFLQ